MSPWGFFYGAPTGITYVQIGQGNTASGELHNGGDSESGKYRISAAVSTSVWILPAEISIWLRVEFVLVMEAAPLRHLQPSSRRQGQVW